MAGKCVLIDQFLLVVGREISMDQLGIVNPAEKGRMDASLFSHAFQFEDKGTARADVTRYPVEHVRPPRRIDRRVVDCQNEIVHFDRLRHGSTSSRPPPAALIQVTQRLRK
jgi:hypothetical protein